MSKPAQSTQKAEIATDHADRLETLLKNLPGMAYRCLNLELWPMEFVSDGCFELCGYHRYELESQAVLWGDFTHPEMINEVDRKVRAAANKETPFEVEYRIITRSGTEKWVWERGRVVDFRDDGVAILEGFITDITDKKLAEASLMRAEAYAQAVVESAVEAVISIDSQGNIESSNRAAQTMFAYHPETIQGMPSRLLFADDYHRQFDQYFRQCRDHDVFNSTGGDLNGCKNDGSEFPLHLSMSEIQDNQEQKYVLLIRDLTNQRAAEKEAREQRELLAHVDRLNTLGEMAAGMAHEINQPLTAISMYAQTGLRYLEKQTPTTDKLQDVLEKLSNQAHRAGAVIERMQEMTKQGDSHQEMTDCAAMIKEVHKLAEVDAHIKNFIIELRLDTHLPAVKSDPVQIQQVVLNLLRNGMESMKDCKIKAGSKIVLQAANFQSGVKISISDNGSGISQQLAKQLYQPFTSTKKSGMGMGLSISQSIISAHGGQLGFFNNKTGGATFFFTLSRSDEESI